MNAHRLRGSIHLRLVATLVALAGFAATASSQGTGGRPVTVNGRVLWDPGTGPEPVACCDVEARLRPVDPLYPDSVAFGRTRADGTYSIRVPCAYPPGMAIEVTTRFLCCGGGAGPVTIVGCSDGAGLPYTVDLGDGNCPNSPDTGRSMLTGLVNCRRGPFLEPVEGCSILVLDGLGGPTQMARTDARGRWEACVPCTPTRNNPYRIVAQCCGLLQDVMLPTGCGALEVPTFTCSSCPVPPCPNLTEVEILGQVICRDPGPDGVPGTSDDVVVPVPDCPVVVIVEGPDTNGDGLPNDCGPGSQFTAITGADGRYRVCVPCPVDGDCASATWTITTQSMCCNAYKTTTVDGCAPTVDDGQLLCVGGCPPPSRPCGIDGTLLHGRLTCVDGVGTPRGVPGCDILVTGFRCPGLSVTATTDADGNWSVCWPYCVACDIVTVEALCCGAVQTVTVSGCPSDVQVDLACSTCPPPPRPCAANPGGIDATEVSGLLLCRQAGLSTPIAGCAIEIRWYAGTILVSEATAITDGNGRYVACLSCGDPTLPPPDRVVATALCCGSESTTPLAPCPATATLDTISCNDCSPCPTGSTRVQGNLICRGGGPVSGCAVVVTVDTCSGPQSFTATTDSSGKYRLCVPCPCPGRGIRVEATCCRSARTVVPTRCGPVTPIPTMFCRYPCP